MKEFEIAHFNKYMIYTSRIYQHRHIYLLLFMHMWMQINTFPVKIVLLISIIQFWLGGQFVGKENYFAKSKVTSVLQFSQLSPQTTMFPNKKRVWCICFKFLVLASQCEMSTPCTHIPMITSQVANGHVTHEFVINEKTDINKNILDDIIVIIIKSILK